ncbi:TauD/TfdA family dioxygenase [Geitlerinema sp. CS-897]|nr:TauD/TfdA family dioxygenase [Geitlerinema sp. CS-897]
MLEGLKKTLETQGYVFIPCWSAESKTEAIAKDIGKLLKISEINGHEHISNIQSLKPRTKKDGIKNQYSGYFGLDNFPLHTDLAHWFRPPRYILLRCIVGSSSVVTKLLPSMTVRRRLGDFTICKAVVKPRKNKLGNPNCLLPVSFKESDVQALRWDSIFLVPINKNSKKIYNFLTSKDVESDINPQLLKHPGDTLIIDNWTMLHGRSEVDNSSNDRLIERAYLTEIKI